jgi:acylphosphatase
MPQPHSPTPSMQTRLRPPLTNLARRYLVSGKVQGVYFRHSTRTEALRLGVRGVVRNLPDGSVEVLVQGDPSSIEALRQWLHRGPQLARVDRVQEAELPEEADLQIPAGFEVR